MNFNLKQLEAFVWVADLGSFRKAADRLNTTQPNISSRISALESAVEIKLMERDAGSVRLTAKGEEMLEQARNVLSAAENFLVSANNSTLLDGTLRLGVTEMIVHTWLGEFLRVLKERYSNITVELTVDLSANLEVELFDRSLDLAFQSGPFNRQTSGSRELGVFPLIWIASPQTGLDLQREVSVKDLVRLPILTHARGTQPYREVAAHFAANRDLPARLVPSSNLAACIQMAIDGYGAATVPAAMVVEELETGQLARVNYGWTPRSLRFMARYEAEKSAPIVARAAEIAAEVSAHYISNTGVASAASGI